MKLAIIGSTGSIGTQALDIINPEEIKVSALSCGKNADLLIHQYWQFKPDLLVVEDQAAYDIVCLALQSEQVEILLGPSGLIQLAARADYDILLTSIVGAAGLLPTIEGIKRGKRIALANKETLVVYGERIMPMVREYGAEIIPVDSEHSALFQALQGNDYSTIERLILTASGGPFLGRTKESLVNVGYEQALKHPQWQMGAKISIDSATLMNKGLEVIEARWLFDVQIDQIEVVVHPQSIVHSLVEYKDGSVMAQMGLPDMKLPIHYALYYPNRVYTPLPRLSLSKIGQLTFLEPDRNTFPCLNLAYEVLKAGGNAPAILNAANEVLVARYLKGEIGFYDIPNGIENTLQKMGTSSLSSIEDLLHHDLEARHLASHFKQTI